MALSGTAADAGSGIASMRFQYALGRQHVDRTPASTTPRRSTGCNWDTPAIADGVYDLRALVHRRGGQHARLGDPANRARRQHRADRLAHRPRQPAARDGQPRGDRERRRRRRLGPVRAQTTAGSTWTTICTDNLTPFTCAWNTTALADGSYDVRAIATDNAGRTAASTVTARVVDNTGPAGTTFRAPTAAARRPRRATSSPRLHR